MFADLIIFLVILGLLSGAVLKIFCEKRKGSKCIGCPYSRECSGKRNCPGENGEILTDSISKNPR